MVIMKEHLSDDAAVTFNDFLFFRYLPDLVPGSKLPDGRMDQVLKFISTYLTFTKDQTEIEGFVVESLITECFPEWIRFATKWPIGDFNARPITGSFSYEVI